MKRALVLMPITVTLGLLVAIPATTAQAESTRWLALGDGRLSTTQAVRGSLFSCQQVSGGGGAQAAGDWIKEGYWSPDLKPAVGGRVSWSTAKVSLATTSTKRTITTQGVPVGSTTGTFPIPASDPVYRYDTNPNTIRATQMSIEVPRYPKVAAKPLCLPLGPIGYALNGVAIFNAIDGEGRDAVAHEIQDACSGHPERTGMYHYHSGSACIAQSARGTVVLIGYALDGFGIYRVTSGSRLTNSDLDACHGRTSKVSFNGRSQRIYHYVVTDEYPYTVGCFRGTPLATTLRQLSVPVPRPSGPPPPRP